MRHRFAFVVSSSEGEETPSNSKKKGPGPAWLQFWEEVYDGGKKQVNNPRKREKGKAWREKVRASTALKKGWLDAPHVELSEKQLDGIFLKSKPDSKKVARAYMRREAAVPEWLQWMAQPLNVILEHHREFVYGPVKDLIDMTIRKIAPVLVRELAEAEVGADLDEFQQGAIAGKADRQSGRGGLSQGLSEDYIEGWQYGFENGTDVISPQLRKTLVEEALNEFRSKVSVQVVVNLLEKIWHAVNPVNTIKAMIAAVKKHGWKLGVGFALFELFEHLVLPSLLTYLFDNPALMGFATLPIGEVVYAVALRALGRVPKELNKLSPKGQLAWFEEQYGPVRIACLR